MLLTATTGMAVSKHFCNEFLISTTLFTDAESCCDDGSCCHNEAEFIQLDEEFQPSNTAQIPPSVQINLIASIVWQHIFRESVSDDCTAFTVRKPPSPPDSRTFLSLKQAYLL